MVPDVWVGAGIVGGLVLVLLLLLLALWVLAGQGRQPPPGPWIVYCAQEHRAQAWMVEAATREWNAACNQPLFAWGGVASALTVPVGAVVCYPGETPTACVYQLGLLLGLEPDTHYRSAMNPAEVEGIVTPRHVALLRSKHADLESDR